MAVHESYNGTALGHKHLIDPEVLGQYLDVKLINAIKLSPLVDVDNTLVGRPGSKLTLPKFAYIQMAEDLDEGQPMEPVQLTATSEDVEVKKAGKAVEISDEAILSGHGNPVNEIGKQLLMAMADKIETDLYAAIKDDENALTHNYENEFKKEVIVDALVKFGEDINEPMYLFVNPAEYAKLRKDADFAQIANGAAVISGHVGQIYGCNVVVANRVAEGEAFIMKQGALALIMKRNVMVEADRNILAGTNVYACNEHYAVQLRYADRVIRIKK
jgi:N4-gp56 family major capsid protein